MAEMVVALRPPHDRLIEYATIRHAAFLNDELIPPLEPGLPLHGAPAACLMGASFGAVASLSTAWHAPGALRAAAPPVGIVRVQRHRPGRAPIRCCGRSRGSSTSSAPTRCAVAERVFVSCGRTSP